MFTPMISAIITRIISKEGTKDLYLKPKIKGNMKWYLFAYLLTPFIAYIGALIFFIFNLNSLDLIHSELAVKSGVSSVYDYYKLLLTMIPVAVLINPIPGLVTCLGEEFGWRGYLLPKLCKRVSLPNAVFLSGFIWGLWHLPIIAVGYNYGTSNIALGIVSMIIFCVVIGTIEAFLFFKTKSIWAGVVFHAAINGIDLYSPSKLFMSTTANPFVGPDLVGIIGGAGFIVIAAFCYFYIKKIKFQKLNLFSTDEAIYNKA